MSDIIIRPVEGDEILDVMYAVGAYAFEASPPLTDRQKWDEEISVLEMSTFRAAFEQGRPVAISASAPLQQNVRGSLVGMAGIWGVASDPAVRRQGLIRRTIAALFEAARDEGRPVSCLYPFRESFYERMGYVMFPRPRVYTFAPGPLAPLLRCDLGGSAERLSMADGHAIYIEYIHRLRERTHGMTVHSDATEANLRNRDHHWVALARVGGEVVGVMLYRVVGVEGDATLHAPNFYTSNAQGRYLLLEWLARHIDQVKEVELRLPPTEFPETWMADLDLKVRLYDPPLCRVIDVMGLSGLPAGPGRFAARISDPLCAWNEGDFTFESNGGGLRVTRGGSPTCTLMIHALAGLLYGTHRPDTFAARGWGDPSSETQAAMLSLFPPAIPYLHAHF